MSERQFDANEAEEDMGASANAVTYEFTITRPKIDLDLVKALVIMAVKETDLVFSPARRKLETNFLVQSKKPACVVAGGTECGEHLARLLSCFLIKQFGEDGFVVKRRQQRTRSRWENPF
jgi:hypothetical protein